ncbi:MAG: hypothetical protein ACXAD7_06300 [Candidatus Kariarchaeaceae archaeon]|jgi:hypothetical protein
MTTHLDDKLPISGDAAETVAAYLEELNTKLLRVGVDNSYSIVAETENLILDEIRKLDKTTKTTVDEALSILKKQGSPDDIVKNYLELHNLQYPDTYDTTFEIDPNTHKLPKREGTFSIGMGQILGRVILSIPIFFIVLALLNLEEGESEPFLVLSMVTFLTHEIYTGIQGKMFETYAVTLFFRKLYRAMLFSATVLVFSIDRIRSYLVFDWNNNVHENPLLWISMLIIVELAVFTRDHTYGFHPIEPDFRPAVRFLTLPYVLMVASLTLMIFHFELFNQEYKMELYLSLSILAVLSTSIMKFRASLRFYFTGVSIVLVPRYALRNGEISNSLYYFQSSDYEIYIVLQLIAILIALVLRNRAKVRSELRTYFGRLSDSLNSY